jgi:hypothetical protein
VEGSEYLLTCAEVAVALAGFSALIIALTNRGDSSIDPVSRAVVSTLVERSLVAVFLSLFPILLSGLSIAPAHLWSICSAVLAMYIASLAWRAGAQRRKSPETREYLPAPAFSALMIVGLFVLFLQILHALGLGIPQSVWWYLVGLTWILMSASYMFYIAVRRWAHAS